MNVISITYLTCAFIAFESGITVIRLNRHSSLNILYAVFTLEFALSLVLFNQFITAPTLEACRLWSKIFQPLFMFTPALTVHFCFHLTQFKYKKTGIVIQTVLYALALFLSAGILNGHLIVGYHQTPWGWDNDLEINIWIWIAMFHFITSITLFVLLPLIWFINSKNEIEKKLSRIIMTSVFMGVFSIIFCMMFLVSYDPFYYTLISDLGYCFLFSGFIIGIRYSMIKYSLMSLSPENSISEIFKEIHEPLFLTSNRGRIIFKNDEASLIINNSGLGGKKSLQEIFKCSANLPEQIDKIVSGEIPGCIISCRINSAEFKNRTFKLQMKGIKKISDVFLGVLVTVIEDLTMRNFMNKYKITDRQAEIISMAVEGLSNNEIADKLGIHKRTVETHVFSIYNKLMVNNRVELLNLVNDFSLFQNTSKK